MEILNVVNMYNVLLDKISKPLSHSFLHFAFLEKLNFLEISKEGEKK